MRAANIDEFAFGWLCDAADAGLYFFNSLQGCATKTDASANSVP
jgi:hypothetical protein